MISFKYIRRLANLDINQIHLRIPLYSHSRNLPDEKGAKNVHHCEKRTPYGAFDGNFQ